MKNHLSLITLILLISPIYSQTEQSPWSFGLELNSIKTENSESSKFRLPSLSLSRYIFDNFSVGLNYTENDVMVSNEELYYYSVDGIIKYNIPSDIEILGVDTDAYVFAGYGLSNYGESDVSLGSLNTSYGPSFGAGINFQLSKNIALNTGVSYKSLDEKNAYSNLQHVVGIKFNFEKGDSDGDGVPDKKDHCPDLPGLIELNGCPDSDGDGIPDRSDPCPSDAGLNGQSCPDSDNDGLTDDIDKCPSDYGPESNGGCKLPDLDNDGVPNIDDRCPNESGLKKLNGCPIIPQSLSSYLDNYGEIYFEFDSFKLNSSQIFNLSTLSNLLKKYNYINLNIDGHASYEGESSYNMILSNKRSNSVKGKLLKDGIKDIRLNLRSFGEEEPNYSDLPISEREKNRRVKISINKDN